MKPIYILLVSLLTVLGAVIWIAAVDLGVAATGSAHPDIVAMRVGAEGETRYFPIKVPLMLLQIGSVSVLCSLIALSLNRHLHKRWVSASILGVYGLSLFVWWQINSAYSDYFLGEPLGYALGFPLPTAWTVYGVWFAGLLFTCLFVFAFDRLVYTADDKAQFEALLAELSKRDKQ